MDNNKYLIKELNNLAYKINRLNVLAGWYRHPTSVAHKLLLIHAEVSEAVEADRKNKRSNGNIVLINDMKYDSDFINSYKENTKGSLDEEIADIIIRALDFAAYENIDIAHHIQAKLRYNAIKGKDPLKNY